MNNRRILGFSLIILSWIFWVLMFTVPFLKLEPGTSAALITILFFASSIFWLGLSLVGKEFMQKYQVWPKLKSWLSL